MENKRNPLKILWSFISSISGIIGLSSLVEDRFDDLLKWKGWIASLIEGYQELVYPIFIWFFYWLPWTIPLWVFDYLLLGLIFTSCSIKGFSLPERISYKELAKQIFTDFHGFFVLFIFYSVQVLLWPVFFINVVLGYVFGEKETDFRDTLLWFFATILGVVILLSINTIL